MESLTKRNRNFNGSGIANELLINRAIVGNTVEAEQKVKEIDEAIAMVNNRAIICEHSYDRFIQLEKKQWKQIAELLKELKVIKEMDLSIPQHFTKEQSDWIKAYCIQRNKEFYNKAIDKAVEIVKGNYRMEALEKLEQLKADYI